MKMNQSSEIRGIYGYGYDLIHVIALWISNMTSIIFLICFFVVGVDFFFSFVR